MQKLQHMIRLCYLSKRIFSFLIKRYFHFCFNPTKSSFFFFGIRWPLLFIFINICICFCSQWVDGPRRLMGALWEIVFFCHLKWETDVMRQNQETILFLNTDKSSDWMFQSSSSPIRDKGVNESRDKLGNYKTNKDLYYHSPTKGRVESGGTTDVFYYGEDPAVASTQRNGLTFTRKTCSNGVNASDLSHIGASQSLRTETGSSGLQHFRTTSKSYQGKERTGTTDGSLRPKILEREKRYSPGKRNQTIKQHWKWKNTCLF